MAEVEMGTGSPRRAWRPVRLRWPALLLLIISATIVPYVLFGEQIETSARHALHLAASRPWLVAALVVLLLASDVVLPVPSSVVGAFAGVVLGVVNGALAVWAGLTLGCVLGYWLGRLIDMASPARARPAWRGGGPWMLVATRAVPVLAETGVIAAGAARMRFRTVLLVTTAANLLVAFAYAGTGAVLAWVDPVLLAIGATVLLAVVLGFWLMSAAGRSDTGARG